MDLRYGIGIYLIFKLYYPCFLNIIFREIVPIEATVLSRAFYPETIIETEAPPNSPNFPAKLKKYKLDQDATQRNLVHQHEKKNAKIRDLREIKGDKKTFQLQ